MDPYFSGVGLVLGVVAKAERRIAVVVDGRKNLFFFSQVANARTNYAIGHLCAFSPQY